MIKPGHMTTIPNLTLISDQYEGRILLPVWSGFQSRQGSYGAVNVQAGSDGIFPLALGGDSMENPGITADHINAYHYLLTHSERISGILLNHLLSEYKSLQADYAYDYDEADLKAVMPDVETIEQFKDLIGLSQVHIMYVARDGCSYVGYQFGCSWEEEHGLGFMTHRDRIVAFGGVDMSFMTWVAKKDLETL